MFGVRQTLASKDTVNGTIILNTELDFERQSMYTLTVFAVVSRCLAKYKQLIFNIVENQNGKTIKKRQGIRSTDVE